MPIGLILSVGREPALLTTRNMVLQSAGYVVVPAFSVKQAADRFREGDFDLIVLCHSIPAEDRHRLIDLIRASGSHIPVLLVSGNQWECDAFADAQVNYSPEELLIGLRELLLKAKRPQGVDAVEAKAKDPAPHRNRA